MIELLKQELAEWLGPLYSLLQKVYWAFWVVAKPDERLYWLYIVTTIAVVLALYLWRTRGLEWASLGRFVEFCLPAAVYRHPSTFNDLKFFLVNSVLRSFVPLGAILISSAALATSVEQLLQHLWPRPAYEAGLAARLGFTLAVVMAADLGYFISHYLQHRVPLLWEFHKVHHSAEVLTPLTAYRFHPVDTIVNGLCIAVMIGATSGAFSFLFGEVPAEYTVLNFSIIMFAFFLTANLRHSHVWLSYGWRLSHVFISPAQHQIHHSLEPRHIDRNLGVIFAFWDYCVGTLYVPREREIFACGLVDEEHRDYRTTWRLYLVPVWKSLRLTLRGLRSLAGLRQTEAPRSTPPG